MRIPLTTGGVGEYDPNTGIVTPDDGEPRTLTDVEQALLDNSLAQAEAARARLEAEAAKTEQDATVRRDLTLALAKGRTYATALTADPTGDHYALRQELADLAREATLAYSGLVFAGAVSQETRDIAFLVQARIADLREMEREIGLG